MKTDKLYERDGHLAVFDAVVLSCEPTDGGFAVMLDRTAFFPEGGGQAADRGTLGGAAVTDTRVRGGELLHITDRPLPVGEAVRGEIDWETRFRRMQNHTGEHIVSGILHRLYGYDNVGFHLGDTDVTLDLNGELTPLQLAEVERKANAAVAACLPVTVSFPDREALAEMTYRSKLDLTENVRIVTVEGIDLCACCAPHVSSTGEIGLIKLLDCARYKGGSRLHILCGATALEDYHRRYLSEVAVSRLLSVKQEECAEGVGRLLAARDRLAGEASRLRHELLDLRIAALTKTGGNRCLFVEGLDGNALRELVNRTLSLADGLTVALSGEDGTGYRYTAGSRSTDLKRVSGDIHRALGGRGGGSSGMIQGSFTADRAAIERYFGETVFD